MKQYWIFRTSRLNQIAVVTVTLALLLGIAYAVIGKTNGDSKIKPLPTDNSSNNKSNSAPPTPDPQDEVGGEQEYRQFEQQSEPRSINTY